MEKESRFRHCVGPKLITLAVTLLLIGSNVYAQKAGRWRGTTSQGQGVLFTVTPEDTISSYFIGIVETCPSGAQSTSQYGLVGPIAIEEQSFAYERPAEDGGLFANTFAGEFTSDTEANGTFSFIIPRLHVKGKEIGAQLCEAEGTWKATWQEPADSQGIAIPSDESSVIIYPDERQYFQIRGSRGDRSQ